MTTHSHHLIINNEPLPIIIRKHKTAKQMILRYQPLRHEIRLTLPRYVSIRQGLHFVKEKQAWIQQEISAQAEKIPLADGAILPVLGLAYTLQHTGGRGVVTPSCDPLQLRKRKEQGMPDDALLFVPGDAEFISRRVHDWLKIYAKHVITMCVEQKAAQLKVKATKISLRDTSSHWGSCGQDGKLSFSWRLILAPYEVLDYVVCHEVAHLIELNHSQEFWQLVASLCPNWRRHRCWLAKEGSHLYRFV